MMAQLLICPLFVVVFVSSGSTDTSVCNANKIKCYSDAKYYLALTSYKDGIENPENQTGCNCLPACTSITYDVEVSQAKFDSVSLFSAFKSPLGESPG